MLFAHQGCIIAVSHGLPPDVVFVRRPLEAGFKQEMVFSNGRSDFELINNSEGKGMTLISVLS